MDVSFRSQILAYTLILIGAALALLSAVVPHYAAGYRFDGGVLLSGLLPYAIYGLAAPLLRRPLTVVVGAIVVAVHAVLVFNERILQGGDYAAGLIYYGPVWLALLLVPLVVFALRQPWGAKPETRQDSHPSATDAR